jgi:hypothetical protein
MNARLRARLVLLAIAAVLLPALPAGAARVVQVRIGEHPDFTRVVFELDAPAGYRVERKAGSSDLVVTLDAASQARKLARKSSDIRAVEVEAAEHAVARIRLSHPKLQLKEMILSNPPRIVLDVLREKPVVAAAKPKPAPAPKPTAEAKPAPAPKPTAKPTPVPKPKDEATKSAAPPKPIAETTKPAPAPKLAAEAVPAPAPKPIAKTEPAPAPKPAPEAAKPAPAPKPIAEAAKPPAPAPPPATPAKPPAPDPAPVAELKPPAPAPKALAETAKPPAPAPRPVAEVKPAEPPKPVVELKPPAPKAQVPAPAVQIAEAQSKPAAPPVPTPPSAKPVMTAEDLAKLVAAKSAEKSGEEPDAKLTPQSPATPGATTPSPAKPSPPPGAVVEVAKPAPAPAPAKPAPAPAKPAPAAKPATDAKAAAGSSWLSNPIVLGAAGGALLCVIGLVFLLRRRALPNDLDVTAIAEEHGGADAAGAAHDEAHLGSATDDSFSLFDDDSAAAQQRVAASAQRSAAPMPAADADSEASFASLFDDDELHGPTVSQGAASMNQPTSSDFPMDRPAADRTAATAARPASAVPGADVVRLVQDLERRMSLLEKKLGEANEAREKLERQVAAQSEELRVQRAAIARTQRALRTMTRGEEDKATEPALRDDPAGQTQSKTRINL